MLNAQLRRLANTLLILILPVPNVIVQKNHVIKNQRLTSKRIENASFAWKSLP